MRRIAHIRYSNILCFIHDIWSGFVEQCIDEYDGDFIYTKKYYDIVTSRLNMKSMINHKSCTVCQFYVSNSKLALDTIERYINMYGSFIPEDILAVLSKIQWCGILQICIKYNFLVNFPDNFSIEWNTIERDFGLFIELENLINYYAWEFPDLAEIDSFDPPSLSKMNFFQVVNK